MESIVARFSVCSRNVQQGAVSTRAKARTSRLVGYDERIEIHWSLVLDALVDNRQDLELNALLDWKPM